MYETARPQALTTQQHNITAATLARQQKIWQEFVTSLTLLPSTWNCTAYTAANCLPEETLIFMFQDCMPMHNINCSMESLAPETADAAISALNAGLNSNLWPWAGRLTGAVLVNGNLSWDKAIQQLAMTLINSIGAIELSAGKVHSILRDLATKSTISNGARQYLTLRYGLTFCLLWHTSIISNAINRGIATTSLLDESTYGHDCLVQYVVYIGKIQQNAVSLFGLFELEIYLSTRKPIADQVALALQLVHV
ncbi:hypothetical protein MMC29_003689, partial [Sticta canariensis]|nr:hypothetical protein [Sticta canariensis]